MRFIFLMMIFLFLFCSVQNLNNVKATMDEYVLQGDFKGAEKYIRDFIDNNSGKLNPADKKEMEYELERLKRIKKDFPYKSGDILRQAKRRIKNFEDVELELWKAKGFFDIQVIDGEEFYHYASISNLFFRYPEIYARKLPVPEPEKYENMLYDNCVKIKKESADKNSRYVDPVVYNVTQSLTVKKDIVDAGKNIRTWIPFPRIYPYQNEIEIISSNPQYKQLSSQDYPIRSVFLESKSNGSEPTEFKINYKYKRYATYTKVDPADVKDNITDKEALEYIKEKAPHVIFTQKIRDISEQIVGDEKNPYLIAKKIYKWMSNNLLYSYMVEYCTLRHIPEYIIDRRYGDCGVHALLFITLCRYNGIPARWQSGWYLAPGSKTIHDWAEYYIEPYGWIQCDPDFGMEVMQHFKVLAPEKREELNDFYLHGLDNWRMAANCDHSQILFPDKIHFRSDNVDFQRGETETEDDNIYFGDFRYSLQFKIIK